MLGCESMDCVLHGESFHAGRAKMTRSGLGDDAEEATACRTALRMSSDLYSGLARQDIVNR